MIKKNIAMLIAVLVLAPVFVFAAPRMNAGDRVSIEPTDVIADDVYLAGGMLTLAGTVAGDFIGAGGNVFVSGSTTNDVIVAGGSLVVTGSVGDDLRAAGGNITISSSVGDDVIVAGGQINVVSGAFVGGDLVAAGGQVTVDGTVKGTVRINGGDVSINGKVGDVFIKAGHVVIGPNAEINGTLSYSAGTQAEIREGSLITGSVVFTEVKQQSKSAAAGFLSLFLLIKLAALFVTALFIQWVFGRIALRLMSDSLTGTWANLGRGFVALVVIPVAVCVFFATLIGIPLALVTLFSYIALIIFSCLFIPVFLGGFIAKLYTKSETIILNWKTALLGSITTIVLSFIPVIGDLAVFVTLLIILGTLVRLKISYFKNLRQTI